MQSHYILRHEKKKKTPFSVIFFFFFVSYRCAYARAVSPFLGSKLVHTSILTTLIDPFQTLFIMILFAPAATNTISSDSVKSTTGQACEETLTTIALIALNYALITAANHHLIVSFFRSIAAPVAIKTLHGA